MMEKCHLASGTETFFDTIDTDDALGSSDLCPEISQNFLRNFERVQVENDRFQLENSLTIWQR